METKTYNPDFPVLEFNSKGVFVYLMQAALRYHGYNATPTALFDVDTFYALKKFRQQHYISGDTVCDSITWQNLLQD